MKFFRMQLTTPNFSARAGMRLWRSTAVAAAMLAAPALFAQTDAFVGPSFLPNPFRIQSTVPANGDVNPYGVDRKSVV